MYKIIPLQISLQKSRWNKAKLCRLYYCNCQSFSFIEGTQLSQIICDRKSRGLSFKILFPPIHGGFFSSFYYWERSNLLKASKYFFQYSFLMTLPIPSVRKIFSLITMESSCLNFHNTRYEHFFLQKLGYVY